MKSSTIVVAGAAALLAGAPAADAAQTASAELKDLEGRTVGSVEMRETPSGVIRVLVTAARLPAGEHGFHIHETGACDPATGFKSAGGHLAGDAKHGVLDEDGPHPGDLPNLHVQGDGKLVYEAFISSTSLDGSWFEEVNLFDADGSAVVIHSGPDDYKSQPAGDSGDRIACGILQAR